MRKKERNKERKKERKSKEKATTKQRNTDQVNQCQKKKGDFLKSQSLVY